MDPPIRVRSGAKHTPRLVRRAREEKDGDIRRVVKSSGVNTISLSTRKIPRPAGVITVPILRGPSSRQIAAAATGAPDLEREDVVTAGRPVVMPNVPVCPAADWICSFSVLPLSSN